MALYDLIGGPANGARLEINGASKLCIPVADPHLAFNSFTGEVYQCMSRSHTYLRQENGTYLYDGPTCKDPLHAKNVQKEGFYAFWADDAADGMVYTKCPGCSELVRHLPEKAMT